MTPKQRTEKQKARHALHLLAGVLATSSLSGLLGQQVLVNVGQDTTLGDGNMTQKLVQLLIVPDGKLQMTGDDTGLLIVAGGVASQLENLSSEVLEDGSQIDGSTGTDTLGVVTLAEQTVDTTDGESETSLGRTGLRVLGTAGLAAGLAASSHFECRFGVEKVSKSCIVCVRRRCEA